MKRWIAVLVVMLAVVPCAARADDASKTAKVKELFALMHIDHSLDRMRSAMAQQVQATAKNAPGAENLTPEKQKMQQEFIDNSMKVVDDNFSWAVLEPAYVKLYADTYTEAEIDGILAFYKSPSGQAMLAKTPQLSGGVMQIVHGRMDGFQPKMQGLQELYLKAMAPAAAK